jgi:hypothetical protein
MKKNRNKITIIFLVIFTSLYYFTSKQAPLAQDYYELNATTYLKKNDYFSSYSIYQKVNENYQPVFEDIESLTFKNDSILAKYGDENILNYILISKHNTKSISENNKNTIDLLFAGLESLKPWHVVEQKTISDSGKLIPQLLLFLIIISALYLFINIFKVKQIHKRQ